MTIQKVCEQATSGRGLWAGVFPVVDLPPNHPLAKYMPPIPHVTLAHFGRANSLGSTISIHNCLARCVVDAMQPDRRFMMEITGLGLFWRRHKPTVVALVNGSQLCDLRADFMALLSNSGVRYDDRYGFIPHLTLQNTEDTAAVLNDGNLNAMPVKIIGATVKLVCGDAEVVV